MEKAALVVGSSIRSISAGGGLPVPYREGQEYRRCRRVFRALGCHAAPAGDRVRPRDFAGDRARPLSGRRKRLPDQRNPRDQNGRREHVLPARRRLQQPGPPHPVRRVSPMAICPASERSELGVLDSDPRGKSSSAAPCANRATSSPRKKAASSHVARCPQARGRRLPGHRSPAPTATSWPATTTRSRSSPKCSSKTGHRTWSAAGNRMDDLIRRRIGSWLSRIGDSLHSSRGNCCKPIAGRLGDVPIVMAKIVIDFTSSAIA